MAEKRNLSDAQRQQIRDRNQAFRRENRAFLESSRRARRDFREKIRSILTE